MNAASIDPEGLIFAFRLDTGERLKKSALELEAGVDEGPLWLHFNLYDNRTKRHLERFAFVDEEARALLVGSDAQVRILVLNEGFAAVLGDFHHEFNQDAEAFGKFRVYVDPRVIITCRQQSLRGIDILRRRVESGETAESPAELFERLVRAIAVGFTDVALKLGDWVEDAEDDVLAGKVGMRGGELGRIRRLLARLRRHASANRNALRPLPDLLGEWCLPEQAQRLREAVERLDAVGQDLELVTERARLVQEEIERRLNEATGRNLYLLSILTTTLLPITLITGIFGMNLNGMPFANSPHGFWTVMLVITVAIVGVMLAMRRRGVF
ncbi:MAG TPA: CorA family divalent cation transporter [Polyangiaceae bacterium]|nr:CorA family divalent cation transporter [Polyangiaceae bacterium]